MEPMGAGSARGDRPRVVLALGLALLTFGGLALAEGPGVLPHPSDAGAGTAAVPLGRAGPASTSGPYLAYGNSTIVLPGWNSLSAFAWNCNTNVSRSVAINCFGTPQLGYAGTQVPLVSWTADGVFYVNASLDLVFYSFVHGTVTRIAPWLPLYDNTMYYTGETNTEYITADGTYVYELGCLAVGCRTGTGTAVTSYAVNVTTGRTFEYTWPSDIRTSEESSDYTTYWNAQTNLVGVDGNDSILTLTVTWGPLGSGARNGTVWAYNLWTGAEWKMADLPFFEANNLYWVPEFSQFFDVAAEGSSRDAVAQGLLGGSPEEPSYEPAGPFTYSTGGFGIGGVDGLWVDLESREVAFQADWQGAGKVLGVVAQLGSNDSITGFPSVVGPAVAGSIPTAVAGEHRESVVTGPPAFGPTPSGAPTAWLSDPLAPTSSYLPTNVSQNLSAWNVDGSLFYNASYSVLTSADQCERPSAGGTACAILGTLPGTTPGTVWWTWRLGLPEFPFAAAAPLAETNGPPPIPVTAEQSPTGLEVNWTVPAADLDPIVNYSLSWGPTSAASSHYASLPGNASRYSVTGVASNATVYYALTAWNLHGPTVDAGNLTLGPEATPAAPTLTASYAADPLVADRSNLTVVLTEGPAGAAPIVNDTLYWGNSSTAWSGDLSGRTLGLPVGSGTVVWSIPDVPDGATYYFAGVSWNAWGAGAQSSVVSLIVPTPTVATPPPATGAGSVWPIVEVAGGVIGVFVVAAVAVIYRARRRRRQQPPV